MSFLDDLVEQDAELAGADASNDQTIRTIIESAAKDANVRALQGAIDRGQVNQNTPYDIVVNVTGLAGKWKGEFSEKERASRLEFVETWIKTTTPDEPQARQERLNSLLQACYVTDETENRLRLSDSVAKKLLEFGADPLAMSSLSMDGPMAGARIGLSQTKMTLLAHAMYNGSDITGSLLLKNKELIPIVATVERDGISHELNAAGYALALGDMKQLRAVLGSVDKQSDAVRAQMMDAIKVARDMHLTDFGPDEVHHGIAALLAAGATISSKEAAQNLADTPVVIIDSPSMKFFNKDGDVIDGDQKVEDVMSLQRVGFVAAMLNAKNPKDAKGTLEALAGAGWNVNSVANQPVNGGVGKATIAHYAASLGNVEILSTLRSLGCDLKALDAQGRTPATYAEYGLNPQSAKTIDPLHKYSTQVQVVTPAADPLDDLEDVNLMLSEISANASYDDHDIPGFDDVPAVVKDEPAQKSVSDSFQKLKDRKQTESTYRIEANQKASQSSQVQPVMNDMFGESEEVKKAEKAQAVVQKAQKQGPRTLFNRK